MPACRHRPCSWSLSLSAVCPIFIVTRTARAPFSSSCPGYNPIGLGPRNNTAIAPFNRNLVMTPLKGHLTTGRLTTSIKHKDIDGMPQQQGPETQVRTYAPSSKGPTRVAPLPLRYRRGTGCRSLTSSGAAALPLRFRCASAALPLPRLGRAETVLAEMVSADLGAQTARVCLAHVHHLHH